MKITGNITKNFTLKEMSCQDTEQTLVITPETVVHAQNLQQFRDWYNRLMKVNSWYRTPEHNARVGGVKNSQHVQGIATDIALPQEFIAFTPQRRREFVDNCKSKWHQICSGGGGFGIYDTFMHLDSRTIKADFDYRSKKNY